MIRLAEALFALSLATDAGHGYPLEKSLRHAVTGVRFQDEDVHLWTFGDDGRVTGYRHCSDTAKHIAAARQPVAA